MILSPVDATILGRLYDRPNWSRSLKAVKRRVDILVANGFAERVRPPTGGARNMVQITAKGAKLIESHWGKS